MEGINIMQESYSIELARRGDDSVFLKALGIYDQVTPVEIKTDPNDFVFWVDKSSKTFNTFLFKVFCNNVLIGLTMTTYLVSTKVMILEYIAVQKNYQKNVVYLSCINLLSKYFNEEKSFSINYWLTDINNKNNGQEADSESKMLNTILDIEGYKRIDAKFITPELGITDIPGFESYFMIKTTDSIKSISKSIYRGIIKSIYYEYYLPWYQELLGKNDFQSYENHLNTTYKKLEMGISLVTDPIKVINTGYEVVRETTGHTPINKAHSYTNTLKTILNYLITASISVVFGTLLGFLVVAYVFPKLEDKGAIVSATIGVTSAIPLVGIIKESKSKK